MANPNRNANGPKNPFIPLKPLLNERKETSILSITLKNCLSRQYGLVFYIIVKTMQSCMLDKYIHMILQVKAFTAE